MNNLLYSRNVLAIYFSSLVIPDLIMDRSEDERGYEYLQMLDAGDRDSMVQLMILPPEGIVYYVFGNYSHDAGKDIFILLCSMSMWVYLI